LDETRIAPAGLQKINIKLFAEASSDLDYDFLLAVFGRWRLDLERDEIMDLADYGHIDQGPTCLIVGHRYHFGVDLAGGRPGLFLSTRKGLSGAPVVRVIQALTLLVEHSKRLAAEPDFPGHAFRPKCGELEVTLNDRLLAPNNEATDAEWRPGLDEALAKVYGAGKATVEREGRPEMRASYRVRAPGADAWTLDELSRRLG